MKTLSAERQKGRGRFGLLIPVVVAIATVLWASQMKPGDQDIGPLGYSMYHYGFPIMNCVILPMGMALIASRLWEIEFGQFNLLFTLQKRESLYAGKVIFGLGQTALICVLEGLGMIVMAGVNQVTQAFDVRAFLMFMLSTFCVSAMLFFVELFCTIRWEKPVVTLSLGALFSLSSVFTAYMPQQIARFVPWSYYIQLGTVRTVWEKESEFIAFYEVPYAWEFLFISICIAALFAALSWREVKRV